MNESATETHDSQERRRRRWQEAYWAGQTEVLELVLSGLPLSEVLERIARRIEELSENGALCSILLADPSASRLTLAAAPSKALWPCSAHSMIDARRRGQVSVVLTQDSDSPSQ